MAYDCISINTASFSKIGRDGTECYEDVFSLLPGIKAAEEYFLFRLVDIGPFEAFGEYQILREIVRSVKSIGFIPRLLTSGRHFNDPMKTKSQFFELTRLGVAKIVLRLDKVGAESLPKDHLFNFVNACADSGISPDILFEADNLVPEILFQLLRLVEEERFYTNLYVRAKTKAKQSRFALGSVVEGLGSRAFRVVVRADGRVLLRTHDKGAEEIDIGHLRDSPLQNIINPSRLGIVRKEVT